jgi:hypothetical protein
MTTLREAAQQALEALELVTDLTNHDDEIYDAITALRAALAEPCPCGDRPAAECPGEWEPGCDLGNNPKYAKRVNLAEPVQEPDYWQEESRRYAGNADYWRNRYEALAEPVQEPQCNPHPKAPHGFLRNASHNEDRYVCECEGWDPYEAGRQAGMEAALAEPVQDRKPLSEEELEVLAKKHNGIFYDCDIHFARAVEAAHGIKEEK